MSEQHACGAICLGPECVSDPLGRAYALEVAACAKWGPEAQVRMAAEEVGEFLAALCKYGRGRVSSAAVIDEAADAIIMACAGVYLCEGTLNQLREAIGRKLDRLEDRLGDRADYNGKALAIEGGGR